MNTTRSALITTALVAVAFTAHAADTPEGMSWLPSDPLDLTLPGTHTHDLWLNLAFSTNMSRTAPFMMGGVNYGNLPYSIPGYGTFIMFPGMTMWNPFKAQFWTGTTQGELIKISNGTGGGPYPAGSSIYFGGASPDPNVDGGTLGMKGYAMPGVKTVTAQISIGEAYGYSFFDTGAPGIGPEDLPKLKVYNAAGTLLATLDATHNGIIKKAYNGSLEMPPGSGLDEDIYINTLGLQWNLANVEGDISWFQADWTGVQHAQLWSLRLDQTDTVQSSFVFDLTSTWTGATDTNWTTAGNWQGSTPPTTVGKAVFGTGSGVNIDAPVTVGQLALSPGADFTVSSANDSKLTVSLNVVTENTGDHTISSDLVFPAITTVDIGEDTSLAITGDVSGSGFYKRGAGPLTVSGSNNFSGTIILAGGTTTASGTSLTSAGSVLDLKNARLILKGSDRFENEFKVKLSGTSIAGQSAWVQLGDATTGAVTQTFAELNAAKPQYVKDLNPNPQTNPPVHVVSGTPEISTLTLKGGTYSGTLGGTGTNENNFGLSVEGNVILQGTSTYVGDTVVKPGGTLQLNREEALSANSAIKLQGGVLALGAFSYMTPGGENDNGITVNESIPSLNRSLGTGPGQIEFTSGTLRAVAGARSVNFGGNGDSISWGQPGFIAEGSPLVITGDLATSRVVLANALNLGSTDREVQVNDFNSVAELSGKISGSGGLIKSGTGTLILTGDNDFTGPLVVDRGKLGIESFGTAGTSGPFGNTSNAASSIVLTGGLSDGYGGGILNYTGSENLVTDRLFTIKGTVGSVAVDGTGTLHFTNTGAIAFDSSAPSILELRGINNTPSRFDPLITDNGQHPVSLRKAGSGAGGTGGYWIIGNENHSYTGQTVVNAGTLEVSKLANGGQPSSIGASSSDASNLVLWRGRLLYTGPEVSTDRLFAITTGSSHVNDFDKSPRIDSSGTGAMHFTNTGSLRNADVSGTTQEIGNGAWLTLMGSFTGADNTFAPRIGGGIAANSRIFKEGPGTWVLSNTGNSWVGITEITGGTLAVNSIANGGIAVVMNTTINSTTATVTSATGLVVGMSVNGPAIAAGTTISAINGTTVTLSLPATFTYSTGSSRNKVAGYPSTLGTAPAAPANLVINGGTLRYDGAGDATDRRFTVGINGAGLASSGTGAVNFNSTAALTYAGTSARTLTLGGSNAGENTLAAAIGNAGTGVVSVTKSGSGTWVLGNANTYTGNTTVTGGTLKLTAAALADASTLSIAAGATVELAYPASAIDLVDTLILGGEEAASGVWGAEGSGAQHTSPLITGTGLIRVAGAFEAWAAGITNPALRDRDADADGDGISNLHEYLFGTSAAVGNGSLVQSSREGGDLILRWNELVAGGVYQLQESTSLAETPWPASEIVPVTPDDQEGVPDGYIRKQATVPIEGAAKFFRVSGSEE
ncbi:beta strand repeat-containing protein [Luteolibacter flavescens]|uniref:beta strand repeat-containing protein n=1 Tax=Luteolibacter flavescens TaxID=1859460 RepID=UPI0029CAAF89|nr:autotransporter-associated beta strand repeat-containing protein [Luteolibacter flavescens]